MGLKTGRRPARTLCPRAPRSPRAVVPSSPRAVAPRPQGVELSAYRIVQEALSNPLRHAPGASTGVEVSYVLGGLGLRLVNGAPPHPGLVKASSGAGHGITGMRERVSMLNGEMTAGPTGDGGYEVTVFLPAAASVSEGDA